MYRARACRFISCCSVCFKNRASPNRESAACARKKDVAHISNSVAGQPARLWRVMLRWNNFATRDFVTTRGPDVRGSGRSGRSSQRHLAKSRPAPLSRKAAFCTHKTTQSSKRAAKVTNKNTSSRSDSRRPTKLEKHKTNNKWTDGGPEVRGSGRSSRSGRSSQRHIAKSRPVPLSRTSAGSTHKTSQSSSRAAKVTKKNTSTSRCSDLWRKQKHTKLKTKSNLTGGGPEVIGPFAVFATHVATSDVSVTFIGGFFKDGEFKDKGWTAFLIKDPAGNRHHVTNLNFTKQGEYVSINIRDAPIWVPEFEQMACPYVTYEQRTLYVALFQSATTIAILTFDEDFGSFNSIFLDETKEGWYLQSNYAILHVAASDVRKYTVVCRLPERLSNDADGMGMKEADLFAGRFILASSHNHDGLHVYDLKHNSKGRRDVWMHIPDVAVDHFQVVNTKYIIGAQSFGFEFEQKPQHRVLHLVRLMYVNETGQLHKVHESSKEDEYETMGYASPMIGRNIFVMLGDAAWVVFGVDTDQASLRKLRRNTSLQCQYLSVGRDADLLYVCCDEKTHTFFSHL